MGFAASPSIFLFYFLSPKCRRLPAVDDKKSGGRYVQEKPESIMAMLSHVVTQQPGRMVICRHVG
jgi:hypothetical protein